MATGGLHDSKFEALAKYYEEYGLGHSKQERLEMAHSAYEFKDKSKDMRNEQKSEDESFRQCPLCGEKGKYRCTGCYLELYCSEVCQRQDWKKGHKAACKVVRAQFKEVKLTHYDGFTGKMKKFVCEREATKKKFVVKIVVINMVSDSMVIANEDDWALGNLERSAGQEELYDVRKEVIEKGLRLEVAGSYTGCYYALYKGLSGEGGHKLEINPDRMQPMEVW